jgi:hypothetical protein
MNKFKFFIVILITVIVSLSLRQPVSIEEVDELIYQHQCSILNFKIDSITTLYVTSEPKIWKYIDSRELTKYIYELEETKLLFYEKKTY